VDAAKFGEVVVLATKGTAAEAALKAAGMANLNGKTVIDTTHPIADAPPVHGVLQYFTSQNDSLMERLQKLAPEARFVKARSRDHPRSIRIRRRGYGSGRKRACHRAALHPLVHSWIPE
jgi:predicted dinucleotide-binding enzyme